MIHNFFDIYGDKSFNDIFNEKDPLSIYCQKLSWIEVPEDNFIDYVINRNRLPFEGVPEDDSLYKKDPTYMLVQMHRLWITTKLLCKYFENNKNYTILDLGAFPFSLEIIIREYFNFGMVISASTNWALEKNWKKILKEKNILISFANLDPYIKDASDYKSSSSIEGLKFENNSIDLVILAHVVEHLYHPLYILKEAWRVLKEKGIILISTDNALMLNTLINICTLNDFLHEPVEQTAAMSFHTWRGHCRFFSKKDLIKMLNSVGFKVKEVFFFEILYNSFCDEYFRNPTKEFPKWKADILTNIPDFRSEIILVAEK
jgi:SAM-dependent methyltransferase